MEGCHKHTYPSVSNRRITLHRKYSHVPVLLSALQVSTETVDWKDGEDPIYRTIIPIDNAEHTELTSSKRLDANLIESVGVGRQSLKFDWPKNQEPRTHWGTGVRVGVHD